MSVRVLADAGTLADAAATDLIAGLCSSVAARGRFDLAVSGGRTPAGLFARLTADPWRAAFDVARTHVWFADERAVPPDHPDSNYRMVRETLLAPLGIPESHAHRMRGEMADLVAAADAYAATLPERLDLVVLGIGEDGHTASLFPGSPLVAELVRRVAAVFDAPKPPPRRLTLTPPALRAARGVMMLAEGPAKADAVAAALAGTGETGAVPARLVRERDWYLDPAAAARLAQGRA
jgi:6-phosphogluconolactonase